MEINLSNKIVNTVCNSLKNSEKGLKHQLEIGIPCGKVNLDRKGIIEQQLAEVEEALQVFEELKE